jgi:hypothetical protein
VSTVTAIGAAAWHEFLAPKADAASAAITSSDQDVNFVYKHQRSGRSGRASARALPAG